jgi:hypothetical protein
MATIISGDSGGTAVTTATQKVLQVVNLVYSTQGSMTVGTSDTNITGMNLSITPLGAGSKFRIDVRLFGEFATPWSTVFNIHRGSTRINTTGNQLYHGLSMMTQTYGAGVDNSSTPEILHLTTIDSTGSSVGTAITYTLVASADSNYTLFINRSFDAPANVKESGISEIIITEIEA